MKVAWASSSPISPVTTGTWIATGATEASQQLVVLQVLKLYTWKLAASWFWGSLGFQVSHWAMSLAKLNPPSMMTFVAPVLRTAVTRDCMPATGHCPLPLVGSPPYRHPSRQQGQSTPTGSLKRSNRVAGSLLNVVATWLQNVGEWSASGIPSCQVAWKAPGADQCSSTMA